MLTWSVWVAGSALTAAALAGSTVGMIAATAALMTLFCPWVLVVWRTMR